MIFLGFLSWCTKRSVNLLFQIVVVFYVAIVLLLIGTNLRAGGAGRGARFKKHVVEYTEGCGAENRLVPSKPLNNAARSAIDLDDDIADV